MIGTILDLSAVLLPGLGALAVLAWLIGRLDADARDSAWRRIAAADQSRHYPRERDLAPRPTGSCCAHCPAVRLHGDRTGS